MYFGVHGCDFLRFDVSCGFVKFGPRFGGDYGLEFRPYWTLKVCKIMALRAILRGLGLLFYILLGFRLCLWLDSGPQIMFWVRSGCLSCGLHLDPQNQTIDVDYEDTVRHEFIP